MSTQRVVTQRPGFVWDGRIAVLPGIAVRVHDAYVAGEGILHPALFGLITLADMRDTGGDVARGELMRFFAEAVWYPTALLPSQGVRWESVDNHSAKAALIDGALSLTVLFRFGNDDFIESVQAEARGRTVGSQVIPTPWEGRFSSYQERSGMHVPLRGEVAWLVCEGRRSYWRGQITRLVYDFARSDGMTRDDGDSSFFPHDLCKAANVHRSRQADLGTSSLVLNSRSPGRPVGSRQRLQALPQRTAGSQAPLVRWLAQA